MKKLILILILFFFIFSLFFFQTDSTIDKTNAIRCKGFIQPYEVKGVECFETTSTKCNKIMSIINSKICFGSKCVDKKTTSLFYLSTDKIKKVIDRNDNKGSNIDVTLCDTADKVKLETVNIYESNGQRRISILNKKMINVQ